MSLLQRPFFCMRLVLPAMALFCSASMADTPATPEHFWSVAPEKLAIGNRALLHLEICDRRQFQWAPMVLPTHPALLAQFKSEIAIQNSTNGQPCEGSRWTWSILPTQAGDIELADMAVRYSEFGREVPLRLTGASIRVRGRPEWLPSLIANEAPSVFRWEPVTAGSESNDGFVQHSVLIQSSLSRKEIEQWLTLMLESQPAWAQLPPLIRPQGDGLGDAFLITIYAPLTPPSVPPLTLRLGFFNSRTKGIDHRVLSVSAQEVQGASDRDRSSFVSNWARLYSSGLEQTPWIATLVILLLSLHWILRRHVWRLYRRLLLWRIARAGNAQEVWAVLKRSPWPVAAGLASTPAQWAGQVAQKSRGVVSMIDLHRAVVLLESALFSDRCLVLISDIKLLLQKSMRAITD